MTACQYGVPAGTHAPSWRRPILIVVGVPLCALLLAAAGEVRARGRAEAAALEPILTRVREREDNVRSLYLAWTETVVMPKDSPYPAVYPGVAAPSADAQGTTAYSLLIDGARVRFSAEGEIWNVGIGEFVPFHQEGLYADGIQRSLYVSGESAVIRQQTELMGNPRYRAPLLAYRLLDPLVGPAGSAPLVLLAKAELDGHPCTVIEKEGSPASGRLAYRWWLAEDMDFFVVRAETVWPDGEGLVTDLTYDPDPNVGWRLASWTIGGRTPPVSAQVTEAWFNRDVASGDLELTFPPGTRVHDTVLGVDYVVGPEGESSAPEPSTPDAMEDFAAQVERQTTAPRSPPRPTPVPEPTSPELALPAAVPASNGIAVWMYAGGVAVVLTIAVSVWAWRRRRA